MISSSDLSFIVSFLFFLISSVEVFGRGHSLPLSDQPEGERLDPYSGESDMDDSREYLISLSPSLFNHLLNQSQITDFSFFYFLFSSFFSPFRFFPHCRHLFSSALPT